MEKYHLRRFDKEITDYNEIKGIIQRQEYLTLAMSRLNRPYLVSLNYGYDVKQKCFYFHCASEGKKIDYLYSNPRIYGQILENLKYLEGKCSYAYRSVQFEGEVSFVEKDYEKKHALQLMVDKLEIPALINKTKEKFMTDSAIENVVIGKINVTKFSAKEEKLTS
ncbi:MAG: pyridoxamine 5'-phosphate oxidase family protein [Candidatus Lokiarchaeota archaeon]|nr:pyridoxamine 5'-phosphate oxidase family protein [Candidatus Lokiarchaeota archaeon]